MKIRGLDGKEYVLDLRPNKNKLKDKEICRSNIQYECGQLLKQRFPYDTILEEVHLPGSNNLYLDFLLPTRKLAFEIHGKQHDEFVPFFHNSRKEFHASQGRDINKEKWCILNNIELYVIRSITELNQLLYE